VTLNSNGIFKEKRRVSSRVEEVPPSGIRRFFDLASEMKGVISLGVGEPDFVTPWNIREACVHSLEQGYTMYTPNSGLPELREEIAKYFSKRFNLDYDPNCEVLVTVGASEAIDLALRALVEPGDEVLIPEPCFVSYKPCTIFAGGTPVTLSTTAQSGFKIKPEDIITKITPKTKILLLSYPCNPTGASYSYQELLELAGVVEKYDLLVISDEIYSELTYDGFKHYSFASLPNMKERTIVHNGFSKAFAMTGWRIGFAAGNENIISAMTKIHQYSIMCAPIMGQKAAVEALRNGLPAMNEMVAEYEKRKRLIVSGLRDMGLSCIDPQGAFYVFPSIKETGLTSEEFAEMLLREEKVAVVPGTAFGECGEGHVRCSYAASTGNIIEALNRMRRLLGRLNPKVMSL
jgi:aminotransferase